MANHSPEATTLAVMSRAGHEPRQPAAVPRLRRSPLRKKSIGPREIVALRRPPVHPL